LLFYHFSAVKNLTERLTNSYESQEIEQRSIFSRTGRQAGSCMICGRFTVNTSVADPVFWLLHIAEVLTTVYPQNAVAARFRSNYKRDIS
ncbi:MAG: hypothetical protein Q4F29_04115, partial [Lachnospiraceae bacterium]|nr:hypothetical protein [Lachnospiraceae bacterium]